MGSVTYFSYHPQHGQLAYTRRRRRSHVAARVGRQQLDQVGHVLRRLGLEQQAHAGGSLPTAIEHVTRHEFDDQARRCSSARKTAPTARFSPGTTRVYQTTRQLQFPYWDTTNNRPLLPIEATVFDDGGTVTEQYAVDPARTAQSGGVPTGLSDGTDQTPLRALDAAAV